MEPNKEPDYSLEVQDIIGRPPSSLVRWGTGIVSGIVIATIIGTFLFKYPIILSAPVVLFSQNPPVEVVSKVSGSIDTLLIQNRQTVKRGEYIAVIQSTAKLSDIFLLLNFIDGHPDLFSEDVLSHLPPQNIEVGELQDYYATFRYNLLRHYELNPARYFSQKNTLLKNQRLIMFDDLAILNRKIELQRKELEIEQKKVYRDSLLLRQQVLSASEFDRTKQNWLHSQSIFKALESEHANLLIRIGNLNDDYLDLSFREYERNEGLENQLLTSLHSLKKRLALWKDLYLLAAPADGVVAFNQFWYSNQFVKTGETVFSIVPQGNQRIKGRVRVSPVKSGLIKPGQQVRIKLDNYPYLEFGVVTGRVNWISDIPENGAYLVEVLVPTPFQTNYQKPIRFQQELGGTAEIITDKQRLIVHIISPLRWLFSRD